MGIREDFVALAVRYIGCSYARDAAKFMDLIATGEEDTRARAMCAMSTCGLACRGWLLKLGLVDPRLSAPYHDGKVMSDLAAMAREAAAVKQLSEVQAGDILFLAQPEHALVVESIDGTRFSTCQGGERDEFGTQMIQWMPRSLFGGTLGGRPVELVIDIEALAAKFLP